MSDITWIVEKMVCGSIFLEILENKQEIKLNEDGRRHFYIGLLGETKKDETNTSESKSSNQKDKKQSNNIDPFIIGYKLSQYLENNTQFEKGEAYSAANCDAALWQKYQLDVPKFRPFFFPPIDNSHFSYTRIYNIIVSNLEQLQKFTLADYNNEDLILAESFAEESAIKYFQSSDFLEEKGKKINSIYLVHQKSKKQKNKEDEIKWVADEKKKKYYVYCWRSICNKAFPSVNSSNNSNEEMQRNCQLFLMLL